MENKSQVGFLFVLLLCSVLHQASAASLTGQISDPEADVVYYQYSNSSGYSITTTKRPSIDATLLQFHVDASTHIMTMKLTCLQEPTVDQSYFYYGNFVLAADNGSTFSFAIFYSNFVGQATSSDVASNETVAALALYGTAVPQYNYQQTVTHKQGNSIVWHVDLSNYTSVITNDQYKLKSLTGMTGQEVNPNSGNTDYYLDNIQGTQNNSTGGLQTTQNPTNISDFGLSPLLGLPLWLTMITSVAVIYRKNRQIQ